MSSLARYACVVLVIAIMEAVTMFGMAQDHDKPTGNEQLKCDFTSFIPHERRPNVIVDLGANYGSSLLRLMETGNMDLSQTEVYLFEPNPKFKPELYALIEKSEIAFGAVLPAAAWDRNTVMTFFVQDKPVTVSHGIKYDAEGSSLFKRGSDSWTKHKRPMNMTHLPIKVCAVDLAEWLTQSFSTSQNVIVKMDTEGAEFEILRKLLDTPVALSRISKLYIEWHGVKIRRDICGHGSHCAAEDKLVAELKRAGVHVAVWNE